MTTYTSTQQLQDVIAFPFKDADWFKKLAVGSLLVLANFLLPILPLFLVYGYLMRVMRRIIVEAEQPTLPEWNDWGSLFFDGLRLAGAGLVYSLPALILFFLGYLTAFLPAFLAPWLEGVAESSSAATALLPIVGMMLGFGGMGLGILLGLAVGLIVPAALGHLVAKDRFSAAFEIGDWWPVFRANFTGFLLAFVLLMGLTMIGSFIFQILYFTIILCCLLPLVLSAFSMYLSLIASTLFAGAYYDGLHRLEP